MSRIFLSHSSADNAAALELKQRLARRGYEAVFLDFDPEQGIAAGREWEQELYRALRRASALVVLCSRSSMTSKWVFAEITQARASGKHVFPVKIDDCDVASIIKDRQIVDLTAGAERGYDALFRGLAEAGLDPGEIFAWTGKRPPYPGLDAFQEADAAIFFGRATETRSGLDLFNRLRRFGASQLVIVLGASGSGKSSLVRAGVLPRLRRDANNWLVIEPFRPGKDPLRRLAVALSESSQLRGGTLQWQDVIAELERTAGQSGMRSDGSLSNFLTDLQVRAGTPEATPLVVVDQFEELLQHAAAGDNFLELLRRELETAGSPFIVLGTLRSDFLPALEQHPATKGWRTEHVHVPALARADFAEIIEAPARLTGLELEPGLVGAILTDAETSDALPLLAFALRDLWERYGGDGRLTIDEYRGLLGGLSGAIARAAETAIPALSAAEEDALWSALALMVRVDEEGRYVRTATAWDDLPAGATELVERLVRARLLVSSGSREGPRVLEVAHEAVFRTWPRLTAWLADNREFLSWRQRLRRGVVEWLRTERDPGALLRGVALTEATRWAEHRHDVLSPDEHGFVRASLDQHATEERLWKEAYETSETRRRLALSRQLAAQAVARLDDGFDLALLLGVEASREEDTFEARGALYQALVHRPHTKLFVRGLVERQIPSVKPHRNPAIAFSADGKLLVSTGGLYSREVLLWDLDQRPLRGRPLRGHEATVSTVAISDDGTVVASGDSSGVVLAWDIVAESWRECQRLDHDSDEGITSLALCPRTHVLAAGTYDNSVRLWDAATGRPDRRLTSADIRNVTHLAFSRDGRLLAAVGMKSAEPLNESVLVTWDVASGEPLGEPRRADGISTGRGGPLAWSSQKGDGMTVWDVGTLWSRAVDTGSAASLDATSDGHWAVGHDDGRIELRDADSEKGLMLPAVHTRYVDNIAFSPDGTCIASTGPDDAIILWDRTPSSLGRTIDGLRAVPFRARGLCFGSSADRLAVAQEGSIAIVDVGRGEIVSQCASELTATGIVAPPDGRSWLVTTAEGPLLAIDSNHPSAARRVRSPDFDGVSCATAGGSGMLAITRRTGDVVLIGRDERPAHVFRPVVASPITSLALGADRFLVAGHDDGSVTVWDVTQAEQPPRTVTDFDSTVVDLAFDRTGSLLVAAGHECFTVWDPITLRPISRMTTGSFIGAPLRIALSPNGYVLAYAQMLLAERTVIHLMDGRARQRFGPPLVREGGTDVASLAFSSDGRLLATCDQNGKLVIWDFDVVSWQSRATQIANRTLTVEERDLYCG